MGRDARSRACIMRNAGIVASFCAEHEHAE
jgi:hypothetical protein